MAEILVRVIVVLAIIFVPLQCFLLGAQVAHLRRATMAAHMPVLWRYCFAANVLLPLCVVAVLWFARPPWQVAAALFILSVAPPMTMAAKRALRVPDTGELAIAWQFLSAALCIVTIPLLLMAAERAFGHTLRIAAWPMAKVVLLKVLIPLLSGAVVGRYWMRFLERARPALEVSGKYAGRLLFGLILVVGAVPAWRVGVAGVLCTVFVSAVAIGIGHWLGSPPEGGRAVLTSALALHRAAPAVALAHPDNFVLPTIGVFLVFMAVSIVLLKLYGRWQRQRL